MCFTVKLPSRIIKDLPIKTVFPDLPEIRDRTYPSDPCSYEIYRASIDGDFLYNPDFTKINRQALHSYRLRFTHPVTKKPLVFTAPLPEDMQALFPEMIL